MDRTSTGASGTVRVYAHNPSPLMAMKQSTGRKTPRKGSNGQFLPARAPAKRATAKKTPRRRNPSTPARRASPPRRNPSFGARAGQLYKQAGGLVLGGIAAEQVNMIIQDQMPVGTSTTTAVLVPAGVTGLAGVLLAGMKGEFASNTGLGMVVVSAANLVALGAQALGLTRDAATAGGGATAKDPSTAPPPEASLTMLGGGKTAAQRQANKARRLAAQNGVSGYDGYGYGAGYGVAAPKAGCGCSGRSAGGSMSLAQRVGA